MMAQLKLLQECNHEIIERVPSVGTNYMCRGYKLAVLLILEILIYRASIRRLCSW